MRAPTSYTYTQMPEATQLPEAMQPNLKPEPVDIEKVLCQVVRGIRLPRVGRMGMLLSAIEPDGGLPPRNYERPYGPLWWDFANLASCVPGLPPRKTDMAALVTAFGPHAVLCALYVAVALHLAPDKDEGDLAVVTSKDLARPLAAVGPPLLALLRWQGSPGQAATAAGMEQKEELDLLYWWAVAGGLLLGLGLCAYNAVMVASDVSHWAQSAEDTLDAQVKRFKNRLGDEFVEVLRPSLAAGSSVRSRSCFAPMSPTSESSLQPSALRPASIFVSHSLDRVDLQGARPRIRLGRVLTGLAAALGAGLVLRVAYRHDACAHPARPQESWPREQNADDDIVIPAATTPPPAPRTPPPASPTQWQVPVAPDPIPWDVDADADADADAGADADAEGESVPEPWNTQSTSAAVAHVSVIPDDAGPDEDPSQPQWVKEAVTDGTRDSDQTAHDAAETTTAPVLDDFQEKPLPGGSRRLEFLDGAKTMAENTPSPRQAEMIQAELREAHLGMTTTEQTTTERSRRHDRHAVQWDFVEMASAVNPAVEAEEARECLSYHGLELLILLNVLLNALGALLASWPVRRWLANLTIAQHEQEIQLRFEGQTLTDVSRLSDDNFRAFEEHLNSAIGVPPAPPAPYPEGLGH